MTAEKLLRRYIREVLDGFSMATPHNGPGNVRYDVTTSPRAGGNVLSDERSDKELAAQDEKLAAGVLVVRDGKVLAVSRKDDKTKWGIPGGKVDFGEDPAEAAARELKEETGLVATGLTPVFSSRDEEGYVMTTFVGTVTGQISTSEEGLVRWVDTSTLLNRDTSPFSDYNAQMFAAAGIE